MPNLLCVHICLNTPLASVLLACLSACDTSDIANTPRVAVATAGVVASPLSPPLLSLKDQIAALGKSGQLIAVDRSNSLLGIDANSNGVRDDLEAYINSLDYSAAQVRAAMQKVRILQLTYKSIPTTQWQFSS